MNSDSKENQFSSRWILLSAITLGLPFILLFAYNYSSVEIRIFETPLKKIDTIDSLSIWQEMLDYGESNAYQSPSFPWIKLLERHPANDSSIPINIPLSIGIVQADSMATDIQDPQDIEDTTKLENKPEFLYIADTTSFVTVEKTDSSEQRILLIGDSEAGGLVHLFNDYCVENGHKLVATLVWNSATTYNYGYSSKVDNLIKQYQPSLIVIVLGLNELYARDLAKRSNAANLLRAKLGSTPYLWIGPANFMEDYGINKVYEQTATPERFFLSKNLSLPRGDDKRHPNHQGYKIWMEHIAHFTQGSDIYNFKFDIPKKFGHKMSGKVIHSNAATDRGY